MPPAPVGPQEQDVILVLPILAIAALLLIAASVLLLPILVIAALLLIAFSVLLSVVPAALLGLAAAALSARRTLPVRIALVAMAAATAIAAWGALLWHWHSHLVFVPMALAGTAALVSGGAALMWSTHRTRPTARPAYLGPIQLPHY